MPRNPYEEQYLRDSGRGAPSNPYNTPGTPQYAHNRPAPTPPFPGNYQAPGGYLSGVNGGLMGNLPAPAYGNGGYPTSAPTGGTGGSAAPARIEGPYGNWFDPTSGVDGDWKDAWGNIIAHMNVTPGAGGPGTPAGFPRNPDPTVPTAPVPGVPTPPQQTPQTFYAPTTGSPYLQLGGNFLSYMSDPERAQLNDTLTKAGFQSTGALSTYGPSDYLRPAQFDENDLASLVVNDNVRQWLRFFLGNLGYGASYQLPAGYQPGSGLPTAPSNPLR